MLITVGCSICRLINTLAVNTPVHVLIESISHQKQLGKFAGLIVNHQVRAYCKITFRKWFDSIASNDACCASMLSSEVKAIFYRTFSLFSRRIASLSIYTEYEMSMLVLFIQKILVLSFQVYQNQSHEPQFIDKKKRKNKWSLCI